MSYTNTLSQYRISDGWNEHLARGSRGGVDYAVGVNTPIPAPCDGRLENRPDNGNGFGNYVRFHHGDGFVDEYLHLNSFVNEGNYSQGQIIGYSGNTGNSTGPHVHWHLINPDGVRVNPLDYVQGGGGSTSSSTTDSIRGVQQNLANLGLYDGAVDGITGPKTWRGIQTLLQQNGLYSGAVDGVPGPMTYRGMQQYGQKNGNYAPPGVIDGVVGPLSWAGFYQTLIEDISAMNTAKAAAAKAAAEAEAKAKAAADKAAADAKAAAEKAEKEQAAKPVAPTKPTSSNKPAKPTTPAKETKVPTIKPLPKEAVDAGSDALGILIPKAKNRKVAYAVYGLAALVVSNITVGVVVSGADAPVWLIVASAVIGNLAVPFTTLAIANASNTTK
jgi:murein DD-endopeptidase MepM/ murein hydrolase activator NlpD